MNGACGTYGETTNMYNIFFENQYGTDRFGDFGTNGRQKLNGK
jgi:hypothetical protein